MATHRLRICIGFDENEKPGGQLFKQIHKFFGSREHKAKIRGFNIGTQLLAEADACGVEVVLNATVMGFYQDKEVVVKTGDAITHVKGDAVIIATGAAENMAGGGHSPLWGQVLFLFQHLRSLPARRISGCRRLRCPHNQQ